MKVIESDENSINVFVGLSHYPTRCHGRLPTMVGNVADWNVMKKFHDTTRHDRMKSYIA